MPEAHLADYREFVAYQANHSPTDEIGMICRAAGWFSLIARETPEKLGAEMQAVAKAVAELKQVTAAVQQSNASSLAAAEKIENSRALLQNSEALGTAITDAKKTIGILHWQLFGWLIGAAAVVALVLGLSLGHYWNQQYQREILAGLQQSEQLNKALVESGRSIKYLRDENGNGYILVSKADEAFIGKNGQGVIKFNN